MFFLVLVVQTTKFKFNNQRDQFLTVNIYFEFKYSLHSNKFIIFLPHYFLWKIGITTQKDHIFVNAYIPVICRYNNICQNEYR